jgi:chromate transporter
VRAASGIFVAFLRLGLAGFGGPMAHLAHFRRELVVRRGWLPEDAFASIVAMCHCLPGPTSSQVGFAIGLRRGGLPGGVAAWLGFTLPSAVAMGVAGATLAAPLAEAPGWLLGLKAMAVAAVAHALAGMARALAGTPGRAAFALGVAGALLLLAHVAPQARWAGLAQPAAILLGALGGAWWLRPDGSPDAAAPGRAPVASPVSARAAWIAGALAVAILAALPMLGTAPVLLRAAGATAGAGAFVFGGGHVVLPLLAEPFTRHGWLDEGTVLAGYALAQAMPGPLFTLAAHLGGALEAVRGAGALARAGAAALLLVAVFLPGLLVVVAAWPHWERLRAWPRAGGALVGAGAAVVGVLGAAFANPIIPSGVRDARSLALAALLTAMVMVPRLPVVVVVVVALAGGAALWR